LGNLRETIEFTDQDGVVVMIASPQKLIDKAPIPYSDAELAQLDAEESFSTDEVIAMLESI
jgi:hypothetical protein